MDKREELIRAGLNKWHKKGYHGILNYATGVGKTFAAILATEYFVKVCPGMRILYVCPTLDIISNTEQEFKKFKREDLLKNIDFICYASISKKKTNYSLVVLDECHHCTSDVRLEFFYNCSYKGILGLSASLSYNQLEILKPYMQIVDTLKLSDVVKEGFVAPFTIINFAVELTAHEKSLYEEATKKIDYAKQIHNAHAWSWISRRAALLYFAANKLKVINRIVELFPKEYGIIFSMKKAHAEHIAEKLGDICVPIHSGHSKKERARRLKLFTDNRTKVRLLSAPKIYDEGVTLPKLSYGILLARTSKPRQFLQNVGRILRTDVKSKHAVIIRLYVKDTVEQLWLESSQKSFKTITVNTYEQLKKTIDKIQSENKPNRGNAQVGG